jgi:hypothetical protein
LEADTHAMALSLPRPALLRPQPTHRRLWQIAGLLVTWTAVLAIANQVMPPDKTIHGSNLGHDFLPFYMAGTFARTGEAHSPYDLAYARQWQERVSIDAGFGAVYGPWWNPPHAAWLFAPFTLLPIKLAIASWTLFGICCLGISLLVLGDWLPPPGDGTPTWTRRGLLPLFVLVSTPLAQAISHGQNTFFSLLLLTLTVAAWRANRPLVAGLVCGLLFYKPQLAIIPAIVMTLTLGPRFLAGLGLVGVATVLVTIKTLPPHTLADYARLLPENMRSMQIDREYIWERHVTLRAFWRLLLQGYVPGRATLATTAATVTSLAVLGFGLPKVIARQRGVDRPDTPWHNDTASMRRDRLIAATIAASPLLMPFYFDYDLLLLVIPATLAARDAMLAPRRSTRWVLLAFATLFAASMFNPGLTRLGHVNLSVIALSLVTWSLVRGAIPNRTTVIRVPDPRPQSTPTARAA